MSDPSQVDSLTLLQSARRDLGEASKAAQTFLAYVIELQVTLFELEHREQLRLGKKL